MAFGIPGITAPSQPVATTGAPINQLRPHASSPNTSSSMVPDVVERSDASSKSVYDADMLQRAGAAAQATSVATITMDGVGRLGPTLGQLAANVGRATAGVIRAAAPLAGEVGGAAGLVMLSASPAGETDADLAQTRAIDVAGHQRLRSTAHAEVIQPQRTTFPGQPEYLGPDHTTHPAHVRDAADGILKTPAETRTKPAHTGRVPPDLGDITKPAGTAIHQPTAEEQMTLAQQEKVVASGHAAHLTPSGTLVNGDKAVIDIDRKINGYALNPEHDVGRHKARVFKSALGYDKENSQGLVDQIREGVQNQAAVPGKITKFGTQFGVDIPVTGPSGSATVRTGWNYDPGSDVPRLTTAVVKP